MAKGDETRRAILADAMAYAGTVGLGGLTIGTLAKRSSMSKSGLFAHFSSKEALQVAVLEEARDRFVTVVVSPALKAPRGEPRVRALIDRWLVDWAGAQPGGCIFVSAAAELDDQPGPARERLVDIERDWVDTLETAARIAVEQGHFRRDLDIARWAFELWGIMLAFHWFSRLLGDEAAHDKVRASIDDLIVRARAR